jgi:hypothetical protein
LVASAAWYEGRCFSALVLVADAALTVRLATSFQ